MRAVEFIKNNIWLIVILAIAAILRFYHLGYESAWADEISTLSNSNPETSFIKVMKDVHFKEGFPYIYFLIMNVLHSISYSVLTGRIFSAILGILSVYWIFKLGKVLYDKRVAYFAAGILALNQFAILTSQDARPYALYLLFTIISFYYLIIYIKVPTKKNAIIYGIAAGLLLNTSFYGILNVGSQASILLFYLCFVDKENKRAYFYNLLISAAIVLVFFLPNVYKLTTLIGFQSGWIPPAAYNSLRMILGEFLGWSELINFVFLPLFILFIFKIFNQKNVTTYHELVSNKVTFGFTILFPWLVLFLSVMYIKSYLETSVLLHRYFISLLPMVILTIAASISFISNKFVQYVMVGTIATFMIINLFVVQNYYETPRNTQYRQLTEFIILNKGKQEQVFTNMSTWINFLAIAEGRKLELTDIESLDALVYQMQNDPSKIKSFWLINADVGPFVITPEAQNYLEKHFEIAESFDGFRVYARHFSLK